MRYRLFDEEGRKIEDIIIKNYIDNPLKEGDDHQIGDSTFVIVGIYNIAIDGEFMFVPVQVKPKMWQASRRSCVIRLSSRS